MDNLKTGALIKDLRKEKGMTQKDLADQLHLTDRAVSKWERGLCAPDIATLEPLAAILGVTITELIAGQRMASVTHMPEIEDNVQEVIAYSAQEIHTKTNRIRKKYVTGFGILLASVLVVSLSVLWWVGVFHIIDRSTSPNQAVQLTIFDRDVTEHRFSRRPAFTVKAEGAEVSTTVYGGSYQSVYWSPDSSRYVLSYEDTDGARALMLNSLAGSTSSSLNAYLSLAVATHELANAGLPYSSQSPLPNVDYQFLQWSADSQFMLIYYAFTDAGENAHEEGYFWYDCETQSVSSALEMPPAGSPRGLG